MDHLDKIEEDAAKDIARYFDRINDKIFSFNNLLIAGYLGATLYKSLPFLTVLIPILNMSILIFVEYNLLVYKKIESKCTTNPPLENSKMKKHIQRSNLLSLLSIFTTLVTVAYFLYILYRIKN